MLWLLRTRRFGVAGVHLLGFALPVLLVNVPLLLWKSSALTAAYTIQNARTITAESFVYLPLRLVREARPGYWYHVAADAPSWANRAAPWVTVAAVFGVIVLATIARTRSAALALAALAPTTFLLSNRIFSPQFFVIIVAALATAAALVAARRADVLAVAGLLAVATTANTVLYQSFLGVRPVGDVPGWTFISAAAGVPAVIAGVWLAVLATRQRDEAPSAHPPVFDPSAPATP
jgi:hypothetical protein